MRKRCTDPNNDSFHRYGGRGICVCDRWQSFSNFLSDMDEAPKHKVLDRIDNDGDYKPSNCHWVSMTQQCRNRSSNIFVTRGGTTKTVAEWSEITGIAYNTLLSRVKRGCSNQEIFSANHLQSSRI